MGAAAALPHPVALCAWRLGLTATAARQPSIQPWEGVGRGVVVFGLDTQGDVASRSPFDRIRQCVMVVERSSLKQTD